MHFRKWLPVLGPIVLFIALSKAFGADSGQRVEALPEMSFSESWRIAEDTQAELTLSQVPGRLVLGITYFPEGDSVDMLLKQPIPVPAWCNDFTFGIHSLGGWEIGFDMQLLVRDSRQLDYTYALQSALLPWKKQYFPNNNRPRVKELSTPGFKRPVLYRRAGYNIFPESDDANSLPQPPLEIIGLRFNVIRKTGAEHHEQPVNVSLGDFKLKHLNWRDEPFYYSINGQQYYGTDEPIPFLTLGELGRPHYGEQFVVTWAVRDQYDGQPFLIGEKIFTAESDAEDYASVFLERLEIPVTQEGTYWIDVTKKWKRSPGRMPDHVEQREFRLDVLHGDPGIARRPVDAKDHTPNMHVRLAPDGEVMVFEADNDIMLNGYIWLPEESQGKDVSWTLLLASARSGEVVSELKGTLDSKVLSQELSIGVGSLDPGAYRATLSLFENGKLLDQTSRLMGVRNNQTGLVDIPFEVPSWQELLNGPSIVYMTPSAYFSVEDPDKRWELLKTFLDRASQITDKVEFIIRWEDLEPMPGIYDWSELDRFLNYAHEKGVSVLIWPSIVGAEPEWLPAIYEEPRNEDGEIFNSIPYTFHGGRINHWFSDTIREATRNFYLNLVGHTRGNPAVHGYFVLAEHPDDMGSAGWYIGGSEETLQKFRQHMEAMVSSLKELNQRWVSNYQQWDDVGVPPENASERQRLDWMSFLKESIAQCLVENVEVIRSVDEHRMVQVYTGGMTPTSLEKISHLGTMLADGGSQNPETFGGSAMMMADYGLQRRAEEVTVGQWAQKFPTQLDATMYTMLLGGGGNANIKMFYLTRKDYQELQSGTFAMERFQRFLPIWEALRNTEVMPREAFMLYDLNGGMLYKDSLTYYGSAWTDMMCMEAGLNLPWATEDRAVDGKFIVLPYVPSEEAKVIDAMVNYVQGGGTLFMYAGAARKSPDLPNEDWILLKRFGFQVPETNVHQGGYFNVSPVVGEVFGDDAGTWRMRDYWPHAIQPTEQTLATFTSDPNRPAITEMPFGNGKVVVAWADSIVPAFYQDEYPFMRDIARSAGITITAQSSTPSLWTNLLSDKTNDDFYGLVYHPAMFASNKSEVTGTVMWNLPEGRYQVREMITGRDLGVFDARELGEAGLATTLEPFAVAVYQMKRIENDTHDSKTL